MRIRLNKEFSRRLAAGAVLACTFAPPVLSDDYEHRLVAIAASIERGYLEEALAAARSLVQTHPGSRLGRLMYADLLASRATALRGIGSAAPNGEAGGLEDLEQELLARWGRIQEDAERLRTRLPDSLVQVSPRSDFVVFADLAQSRLFVYRNDQGRLDLVRDFYVTQGLNGAGKEREGDQRTPLGVYYVTGYIPGSTLPSRYGPGALPISYPNPMDRRRLRTGYGIWIHGTEPYLVNRAPQASDGCLSLNNDDFHALNRIIGEPHHTPVVIDAAPEWVSREWIRQRREELLLAIESWRSDWESLKSAAYLEHYDAARFWDGESDFEGWAARKRAIIDRKERIDVTLSDVELLGYPGEPDVVLADFRQRFVSSTFTATMQKQQYWRRGEDGRWRIIFEGASQKSPPHVVVEEPSDSDSNRDPSS